MSRLSAACVRILTMKTSEPESKTNLSELDAPQWAVLTFECCAASGVTYTEARRLIEELKSVTSGLCVVTDEAARRLYNKQESAGSGKLPHVAAPYTFAETL